MIPIRYPLGITRKKKKRKKEKKKKKEHIFLPWHVVSGNVLGTGHS
jgi:hypothetical protein